MIQSNLSRKKKKNPFNCNVFAKSFFSLPLWLKIPVLPCPLKPGVCQTKDNKILSHIRVHVIVMITYAVKHSAGDSCNCLRAKTRTS